MTEKILLINGPNLNLLGQREPEIYGSTTLKDIEVKLADILITQGRELLCFQSNHEGELVDFLHNNQDANYVIINAGAFTHTSVALLDALKGISVPYVEVHISNVHAREKFREHSYLSKDASGIIVGCGVFGYEMAAQYVLQELRKAH